MKKITDLFCTFPNLVYNLGNILFSYIANRCAEFQRRYEKFDMKKLPLILIMMSLFIFQSAWNVAAGFCQHENVDFSQVHETHFGHHQVLDECLSHADQSHSDLSHTAQSHSHDEVKSSNDTQNKFSENQLNENQLNLSQDHHDHLPSMNHILMQDAQPDIVQSTTFHVDREPHFFWNNLYQSPDLGAITPPPLSSPL